MYEYSTLHEIIELQYKRKTEGDNSLLEQSIQVGKGYITPSNFLQNFANNMLVKSSDDIQETKPIYLHKSY